MTSLAAGGVFWGLYVKDDEKRRLPVLIVKS